MKAARISLMGHTTIYGRIRPSRLPGLLQVDEFHKSGTDAPNPRHLGPGAVYMVEEMDCDDAAKAWCKTRCIELDFVIGLLVYTKPLPRVLFGSAAAHDPLDPPEEPPETPEEQALSSPVNTLEPPPFSDEVPF